jgi:hypothetical protein
LADILWGAWTLSLCRDLAACVKFNMETGVRIDLTGYRVARDDKNKEYIVSGAESGSTYQEAAQRVV